MNMFKKLLKWTFLGSLALISSSLIGGFIVVLYLHKDLPSIEAMKNYRMKEASLVFSTHSELVGIFYDQNQRRIVLDEFPELVKQAFISAEDSSFYSHKGVDFFGILRAAFVNIRAGGIRQGASTITQQVAKRLFLSSERSFVRKAKEAILAWRIENLLTKEEIIALYLNHIYLGANSYGVEMAARTYFGKPISQVSLQEAAVLAGLPKAPARYAPNRDPVRAKRRQLYVLKRMAEENYISQEEYEEAANADVFIQPPQDVNKEKAPYFVEYVRRQLKAKYGERMLLNDGLQIYTTLDVDKARYAQNALRKGLNDLERRQGYQGPIEALGTSEAIRNYFKDRLLGNDRGRDDQLNEEVVAKSELADRGRIRLQPPAPLEEGDFLEGVVLEVNDTDGFALVEYEPRQFARIDLADIKWAKPRRSDEDDEDRYIPPVRKVSDVLKRGYLIRLSVKEVLSEPEELTSEKILKYYEEETAESEDAEDLDLVEQLVPKLMIKAELEQDTEVEGALLSVDPRNGFVKAMVGGFDFKRSEFIRAVQASRQPGSAFKPIVYTAALDSGYTPASIIQDSPITFKNNFFERDWVPENYDRKFKGDITLRTSLLQSRNIPTVKILNDIGMEKVTEYARKLGITSDITRDVTMALGSSVVTLDEIIKPYMVFANGGYPRQLVYIKEILDRDGEVLERNVDEEFLASPKVSIDAGLNYYKTQVARIEFSQSETSLEESDEKVTFLSDSDEADRLTDFKPPALKPGQVISSETAYLITHLLKENILHGSGRRARDLNRPASGKTGTTNGNRDAWFMGFTPQLVAGVWVGYDDSQRSLGRFETGSRAAVPIWRDYMIQAMKPYPKIDFERPENIEMARIDPGTGRLATTRTRNAVFEAFIKGTAPTSSAPKPSTTSNTTKIDDLYGRE